MQQSTAIAERPYAPLVARAEREGRAMSRADSMVLASNLIWDAFGLHTAGVVREGAPARVSWIGFYEKTPGLEQMTLAARRDKPACSPIGLHGMCGRCYLERRPVVVRDVATLGEHYIACDPRDRSEAVVPMLNPDGTCWGVLDADSYELGAFDESDIRGMRALCEALGLSSASAELGEPSVLRL